ncbi:MAG: hypothetical protein QM781_13190 [Chitinophagaceae bacterium]
MGGGIVDGEYKYTFSSINTGSLQWGNISVDDETTVRLNATVRSSGPITYAFDELDENGVFIDVFASETLYTGNDLKGSSIINVLKGAYNLYHNGNYQNQALEDDGLGLLDWLPIGGVKKASVAFFAMGARKEFVDRILKTVVKKKRISTLNPIKAKNLKEAEAKGIPQSQLDPSGKPKIHTVKKSNLKRAKDAARNNKKSNSAPIKHSSDKGQKTHFHSTKGGEKLKAKDNIHYTNESSKKNL